MKTYVFDASALFSFLRDRPGASKVDELLKEARHGRAKVLMSAVNYGEVYGLILREFGPQQALTAVHAVSPLPIDVLDATTQRAFQAANLTNLTYARYDDLEHEIHRTDVFQALLQWMDNIFKG